MNNTTATIVLTTATFLAVVVVIAAMALSNAGKASDRVVTPVLVSTVLALLGTVATVAVLA